MKDLKAFLVEYNTLRSSHPPTPLSFAKILLGWNALQILSFLCLDLTNRGDLIAKSVGSVISLFNLPSFCKTIGISLLLPLAILVLMSLGYTLMALLSIFLASKYQMMKNWSLNALCKLEHYALKREVVFLFSLAIGMEAIFRPQNFSFQTHSSNLQIQKIYMGMGIALIVLSVLQYYWQIYTHISVSFDTESITELRTRTSMVLRGVLLLLISALAYLDSSIGVFVGVGVYLLAELLILVVLGSHSNIKLNHFTLWLTITQLTLYTILLPTLWSNPDTLITGLYSQRSIGVLLLIPLVSRLLLNLEKRRMNYIIHKVVRCLADNVQGIHSFEVTRLDFVLKQTMSKFTNLKEHGPEIYDLIQTILQSKRIEDTNYLTQSQDIMLRMDQEMDLTEYCIKNALKSHFYEFINDVYSLTLSQERKSTGTTNTGCYFSYIAFHKDITGNFGKVFIILSQLQKVLGSSVSSRTAAYFELVERDLQKRIAGSGTQKTISAELLFSFLDRSEKIQSSIENYILEAFSFYEMLQKPIVSTKDIKNKGKKLLNDRSDITKELNSLIEVNEYHQQTLLLYEFFLSEIIEETAEGLFFQIKNKIDIFHVAEYYTLYRQQKLNGNATYLELHGWDMSIEFFANHLDGVSEYSIVVFNLNPEHLGKIMKCSTNLFCLLGIEAQDTKQMNISNMEVPLFNSKNLKTLQEKILKGEIDLRSLTHEDQTLYLKHQNGCLVGCSFVAEVEIYGKDPCITCYLRKKKIHEQDFILFSLDTEPKFVGLSKVLRDGLKKKAIRSGIGFTMKSNFRDTADDLNIIELVPSLKTILPNIETSPMWSESQVLLTIPSVPQLLSVQGYYIISYIGKVQEISLLKQRVGVIEIQSYFPSSIRNSSRHRTTLTLASTIKQSSPVNSVKPSNINNWHQTSPLQEDIDQIEVKEFRSEIDEDETNPFQSQEIATSNKHSILVVHQDPKELTQVVKRDFQSDKGEEDESPNKSGKIKKNILSQKSRIKKGSLLKSPLGLQSYQSNAERGSFSGSTSKEKGLEKMRLGVWLQDGAKFSDKTVERASSMGSSNGAHMSYLKTLILENKTPAVLKAVNFFGLLILVTAVVSALVTYFILSDHYNTFSLFAQSASFPAFVRATASAFMITTECAVSVQFFPPAFQSYWQSVTSQYPENMFPIYLEQYNQFILNFNLPFLNEDLVGKSITANFSDLSQLNRNMSFYEATEIFHSYVYQLTEYNYFSGAMDPALLNATRTFMLSVYNMYGEVSNENFKSIYNLYDSSMITLDVIMVIGIIVSVLLMAIFLPIYWKYEKMETIAFSKLCSVSMKELEPNLKKILFAYKQMFKKTLSTLTIFQENISHLEKNTKKHKSSSAPLKGAEVKSRRLFTIKAVTEKRSNILLVLIVFFVSLLLSGTYIVINIIFKNANVKVFPLMTDLEKISNGLPSYFTTQMVMMRLFNEVFNPRINQTLPTILETYESMLNESLAAQKVMNQYLLNSLQRLESSDVFSDSSKAFFQNFTKNTFCEMFSSINDRYYQLCKIGLNNVANTGYLATGNHLMNILQHQIQNFKTNPTLATVGAFYYSEDIAEFMAMNMVAEHYLLKVLQSEQVDVVNYSQKLLSQTHAMLSVNLTYNIGLLILLWIPTITYLRNRFKLSRNIFLLLPIKVLHHNNGIRNLFKTW